MVERRQFMGGALSAATVLAAQPMLAAGKAFVPGSGARVRVMVVNDLGGDPDGLFATVHALLSPSAEVRGIIGTAAMMAEESSAKAVAKAGEILGAMGLAGKVPVHQGAATRLTDLATPVDSPGARAIIAEALRDDPRPLYVTCGGGLTEVASALLLEPGIADRMTLVWIGGDPHDETATAEYNFMLDRKAAMVVFNQSNVPLWQVTSKAYGSCEVSLTELQANVAPFGRIGNWLYAQLEAGYGPLARYGVNTGETWTLGDSPLVLLTALTGWVPSNRALPLRYERTSSPFIEKVVPRLLESGKYEARNEGRRMRLFDAVDTRLMFGDFFAKLRMNYGR